MCNVHMRVCVCRELQVCGNESRVSELSQWLREWKEQSLTGSQQPSADAMSSSGAEFESDSDEPHRKKRPLAAAMLLTGAVRGVATG